MAGILASMAAGGAKGGFDVMSKQAGEEIKGKLEKEKAAALARRQTSLENLRARNVGRQADIDYGRKAEAAGILAKGKLTKEELDRQQTSEISGAELQQKTIEAENKRMSDEYIAELGAKSKEKVAGMKGGKGKDGFSSAHVSAIKQAEEMLLNGAPVERVNQLLATAGFKPLTEKVIGQIKTGGFLGMGGALEDVVELVPTEIGEIEPDQKETSSFDEIAAGIKRLGTTEKPTIEVEPSEMPTEVPMPDGPTGEVLPEDPREWEIQFAGEGEEKPFVMVGSRMVMLTPEEYEEYKTATNRGTALRQIVGGFGGKTEI